MSWKIILLIVILLILIVICVWAWYNPVTALTPINNFLTRDPSVYFSKDVFPSGSELEQNWTAIRDEGWALVNKMKPGNILSRYGHLVDGEAERNWEGWNMVALRFFHNDVIEHKNVCPYMGRFLDTHPEIVSALFSVLAPGRSVATHRGPYAGIIRYHLGLDIPEGICDLTVNDIKYRWQNGDSILFAETHPHSVRNLTDKPRLILMLDIKRSLTGVRSILNDIMIYMFGALPASKQSSLL